MKSRVASKDELLDRIAWLQGDIKTLKKKLKEREAQLRSTKQSLNEQYGKVGAKS